MTYEVLLSTISRHIEEAIAQEAWRDVRLRLRELARILVDAVMAGESEIVGRVDDILGDTMTELSLLDGFDAKPSPTALGWAAGGLRDVTQMSRRRRPPVSPAERQTVLRNAEERILAQLRRGTGEPKSNRDIALELDLNVATVARALMDLRKAGKVRSWREGRLMMNEVLVARAEAAPQTPRNRVSHFWSAAAADRKSRITELSGEDSIKKKQFSAATGSSNSQQHAVLVEEKNTSEQLAEAEPLAEMSAPDTDLLRNNTASLQRFELAGV